MVLDGRTADPSLFTGWEQLNDRLARLDRRSGRTLNLDAAYLEAWIPSQITMLIARLRLDQEARDGVIPSWPPEVAEPAS